ncbi:hypothetical protein EMCRGX_G016542 [Ephydatia muelleri]
MSEARDVQLEAHFGLRTTSGECHLTDEIPCPYKPYGYPFMVQNQYLADHMDQYKVQHIHLQENCWTELKDQINSCTKGTKRLCESASQLECQMASMVVNSTQHTRMEALRQLTWLNIHVNADTTPIQEQMLNEDLSKVSALQAPPAEESFIEVNTESEHNIAVWTKSLELEYSFSSEQPTMVSFCEIKIDDFARRRKEAVVGVTMSLYSIPFYTSRHGYKMCARVYLNGDGMGKGTHLSFYFVVMKGPLDALLPWPFNQKVSLTIINQTSFILIHSPTHSRGQLRRR